MKIELTNKQAEFLIRVLVCSYGEKETDFKEDISDNGVADQLIGKIVGSFESSEDHFENIFYSARREMVCKDPVRKHISMGQGWHSKISTNMLHKRLHFAFHELGMMEQNGGMGTEFDEELNQRNIENIHSVLNDIIYAFGMTSRDLVLREENNK